jgi:predicted acyl esterase
MVGGSYEGELQFATAANHPPHLRAIAPSGISAADYRESYMPGGMVHLGGMASWALQLQASIAEPAVQVRIAAGDTACAATEAKHRPNLAFEELNAHPLQDAWWVERSGEAMADQVTVPTLILMGWQDEWNLNAGVRMFELLRSPHKKIILQNEKWHARRTARHGVLGGTKYDAEGREPSDSGLDDQLRELAATQRSVVDVLPDR